MLIDLLILTRLSHGPAHGYEIKRHVGRILGGAVTLNNNTLYPALRRFEEAGAIERVESEAPPEEGRPPRHVYQLTDVGADLLRGLIEESDPATVAHDAEFKARVAFFDLVPPVVRRQLLAARRRTLAETKEHMLVMKADSETAANSWAQRVVEFELARLQVEERWLDDLAAAVDLPGSGPAADP